MARTEKSTVIGKLRSGMVSDFLKSSGVFLVGSVISKAAMVLMLPLYTNFISAADLGYYDLTTTCINLVATSLYFEIWTAALRFMYGAKDAKPDLEAVSSCTVLFSLSTVVYFVLLFVLLSMTDIRDLILVFVYGFVINVANYLSFIARGLRRNIAFAVSGIINSFILIAVNIIAIAIMGMPYQSMYVAAIMGSIGQAAYLIVRLPIGQVLFSKTPSLGRVRKTFVFALPLCVNSAAYWLLTSFGKLVLNSELGSYANGIYSVGFKFSVALSLVTSCFTYAWQDLAFSHGAKGDDDGFYSRAASAYLVVLLLGAAVLLPIVNVAFPILVGEGYSNAESTIPLFILSALISAFSTFVGNIFYAVNETKHIFFSAVLAAAINCLSCFPLVRVFGIDGVNIAIIMGFGCGLVYRFVLLRKPANLRFNPKSLLAILPPLLSWVMYSNTPRIVNAAYLGAICLAFGIFTITLLMIKKGARRDERWN